MSEPEEFPIKRSFIEETFPVKEVSEESAREKNIRHGHISTLHIWWARRPLAASRATAYAALIPAPEDVEEAEKIKQFLAELCKWENSLNPTYVEKAREDIRKALGYTPRVLDPFAGGGAIPLEALRLGCETYASDYNPVAVLILKAVLEYPQKYGEKLVEDVKKWGEWVLEEAKKEIGRFYPNDVIEKKGYFGESGEEYIPVGYIWARTIPCQNPSCGAEIPLMRQFWLAKKSNKKVALYPYVEGNEVKFKVVGDGYEEMPAGFDPSKGTVKGAIATCLVCGSTVDAKTTRRLFREGKAGERMVAVVLHNPKKKGKFYRVANEKDIEVFRQAEECLAEKVEEFRKKWGIEPVPDEPTPEGKGKGAERAFSVRNYGLNTWGDLFNSRQKLALITFVDKVREAYRRMVEEGYEKEYARGVVSYLGLGFTRTVDFTCNLARWKPDAEAIVQGLTRQAIAMVYDYTENNIVSDTAGTWASLFDRMLGVLPNLNPIKTSATVTQASATELPFPDNHFDAVFTDPPYYDNVPYSYLSDFFYVWLKRTLSDLYPELFSTPLTPKSKEIVAYTNNRSWEEAKEYFENMLSQSFKEIHRILKPNGIAVIVYAHKTTSGWETLINSLLDSGLVITASWPINTEMKARLRAKESAALASSIYIVARKMQRQPTGWFNEVKEELKKHLNKKLDRLWKEGISGADFFISAIGSAIEVFGKYEKVMDYAGNIIRADKLLEYVRELVTDYAVRQILHNGIAGELSPLSRFYLLYRWSYQTAKVHFDEARKLAQSVGVDLEKVWNRSFVVKDKEYIYLLGPHERDLKELEDAKELVDVLHKVLLLWEKGKRDEITQTLQETGWLRDSFFRFAQAVSECLPNDSKEKKLLDGFLTGKERIISEAKAKEAKLTDFFE
mgnify:CR=1 FL=1